MNYEFVIWADNQSGDAYTIEALSYEGEADAIQKPPIASGDFVVIEDSHQNTRWFGQVIEPQRNLPLQGLSRDNPSNVAAMERVLKGTVEASIFLRQVYYYRIRLMGEIAEGNSRLTSVSRRPRAGSRGRAAYADEVVQFMDLPPILDWEQPQTSTIGRVYGVDIPISVDDRRLYQHILVAGATGSGKSNTVANLIMAAQAYGMCVVIFDHKPDYQDVHIPNDESHLFAKFANLGLEPYPMADVSYFSLYNPGDDQGRDDETSIAVRASDVPRGMLSTAMFYRPGEELQRETFEILLDAFADDQRKDWTLIEFMRWYDQLNDAKKATIFSGNPPLSGVFQAMRRKLQARRPAWMDALETGRASQRRSTTFADASQRREVEGYFTPMQYLRGGHIAVIRIDASGREYGLFLSYMLREVYNLRRDGKMSFPVLNVIDEAQDIFQSERDVRETATLSVNEILRKGRSRQIGFVFSLQSATQLPNAIINNLNSRIIHRQNTEDELHGAIPGAPRELLRSALSFGAGEALVSMLGARGVLHAEMAPSPFLLTKDMPESLGTLADQLVDGHQGQVDDLPF